MRARTMNKSKSILASVSLAVLLSGCMGVYEEGFDCLPGVGVGCKSISEVNTMVNQGLLLKKDGESSQERSPKEVPPCKNCSSANYLQRETPDLLVWWAPQWEGKAVAKPLNISPLKE